MNSGYIKVEYFGCIYAFEQAVSYRGSFDPHKNTQFKFFTCILDASFEQL
jgi:hypothetical protein